MHEGHPDIWIGAGDGPEIELKVKASRFLGQVFAARDEAEALDRLAGVRRRYHDARHHCWAYALPPLDRPRERFDDDGEPAQTAGPSILQAIQASGLKALIVVVTRWFGGIKLGSGGLIRAYGETAREALAATPRRENWIESRISIDSGMTRRRVRASSARRGTTSSGSRTSRSLRANAIIRRTSSAPRCAATWMSARQPSMSPPIGPSSSRRNAVLAMTTDSRLLKSWATPPVS